MSIKRSRLTEREPQFLALCRKPPALGIDQIPKIYIRLSCRSARGSS